MEVEAILGIDTSATAVRTVNVEASVTVETTFRVETILTVVTIVT